MLRSVIAALLCGLYVQLGASQAEAAQDASARYDEIRRSIRANRHLSAHFVLAVDARTIKAVRKRITAIDIPVLVRMMGDKDHGVASAAATLLVTLGGEAAPALREAAHSPDSEVAGHARDALLLLEQCYREEDRINPDVCPSDRSNGG